MGRLPAFAVNFLMKPPSNAWHLPSVLYRQIGIHMTLEMIHLDIYGDVVGYLAVQAKWITLGQRTEGRQYVGFWTPGPSRMREATLALSQESKLSTYLLVSIQMMAPSAPHSSAQDSCKRDGFDEFTLWHAWRDISFARAPSPRQHISKYVSNHAKADFAKSGTSDVFKYRTYLLSRRDGQAGPRWSISLGLVLIYDLPAATRAVICVPFVGRDPSAW